MQAKITSKGQLTLPKALRDRLGLKPGDSVEFRETDRNSFEIAAVESPSLDDFIGAFAHLAKKPPQSTEERRAMIGDMLIEEDERIKREGHG